MISRKIAMKSGHKEIIGETIAKLRFFEEGINAYSRFLDTERIDFIVRVSDEEGVRYKEIQAKYGRIYPRKRRGQIINHTWFTLSKRKLRVTENFYYVFIAGLEGELFFIFPSTDFKDILTNYVRTSKSKDTGRVTYHLDIDEYQEGRWGIRKKKKLREDPSLTNPDNYVGITEKYLNNFDLLRH